MASAIIGNAMLYVDEAKANGPIVVTAAPPAVADTTAPTTPAAHAPVQSQPSSLEETAAPPKPIIPGSEPVLDATQMGENIKFCSSTQDGGGRLGCFDDLARKLGNNVRASSKGISDFGSAGATYTWAHKQGTASDGTSMAVAGMQALSVTSSDNILGNGQATLILRCEHRETSLYIHFDAPVSPKPVLAYVQGDSGVRVHYLLSPSLSGKDLGFWNSNGAIIMAKWLLEVERLSVDVRLPDSRSTMLMFDLSGVKKAFSPVRTTCGW